MVIRLVDFSRAGIEVKGTLLQDNFLNAIVFLLCNKLKGQNHCM